MDCSMPGLPVHHWLLEFTQTQVHWVMSWMVMPPNHLILCHPLLLLPSIFPCIRVFSNESVLHIKWPNYWSFSFSISPSNVVHYKGFHFLFVEREWQSVKKEELWFFTGFSFFFSILFLAAGLGNSSRAAGIFTMNFLPKKGTMGLACKEDPLILLSLFAKYAVHILMGVILLLYLM